MKSLSKDDNPAFRKTLIRDLWVMLGVVAVTSIGIAITLYAVAHKIID